MSIVSQVAAAGALCVSVLMVSAPEGGTTPVGDKSTTRPSTVATTGPVRPPYVDDMLFVPVTIGGANAGMWLIDTGAATSVIGVGSPAADKMTALPMQADAAAPSGTARVRMGVVPELRFLDQFVQQLPVIELDLRPAAVMMQMPFDGVLGVNALGPVYRLDFPNRKFTPGPFPEGTEGLLSFEWIANAERPAVVAKINGKSARLTIDSGKNRVLNINRAWLEKNGVAFEETKSGMGFDAAGMGKQARTTIETLEVLGKTCTGVTTIIGERPSGVTDGLVGVGLLKDAEIEIDTVRRTVRVRWQR